MKPPTVPVGYAHGLTLKPAARVAALPSPPSYWGLFRGIRCPFVGPVGMSHALVDVGEPGRVRKGDVVQLPLRRTASAQWEKIYPK